MISRLITSQLEKAIARSPVVLLSGARQTGKTTLVRHIEQTRQAQFITFDDIRFLSAAKMIQ